MKASRPVRCSATSAVLVCVVVVPANANEILPERANTVLGIEDCHIVSIDVDRTLGVGQTIALDLGEQRFTLVMTPHPVRANDYRLLLQQASGAVVDVQPGTITPVRGTINSTTGVVAGVVTDRGLYASIDCEGHERMWIEPLLGVIPDARPAEHVIYAESDAVVGGRTCAADAANVNAKPIPIGDGGCGGDLCVAEMAVDADFEYFSTWGDATGARIQLIVNTNNVQFERDVGITHAIIIRSAEPDPYTATDCAQLLQQFRNEWLSNFPEIPRDVAQMFTGKNLDGAIVACSLGIGTVCTDNAFIVVQSDAIGALQCVTDVHAHELGHAWGAGHCNCPNHTMNAGLECANAFQLELTAPDIIAYRDSVECLESAGTAPVIVHGLGQHGETRPFAGYLDPRRESDNGIDLNLGVTEIAILFSEPVVALAGGSLTPDSFIMTETSAIDPPQITAVDAEAMPLIVVSWDRPITLQEYTTIQAVVQDTDGAPIVNQGNQGPGIDEADRVDIGFLPGDIDQNGAVTPFDLLAFRQIVNDLVDPSPGMVEDYVDTDRNGQVTPFDLLAYRQIINGQSPSIAVWQDQMMNHPRP